MQGYYLTIYFINAPVQFGPKLQHWIKSVIQSQELLTNALHFDFWPHTCITKMLPFLLDFVWSTEQKLYPEL